jgi:probable HAF family extracellular repeat protein
MRWGFIASCALALCSFISNARAVIIPLQYQVTDLGSLTASGPTYAMDINNVGQVAGINEGYPSFGYHGFRWTNGTMTDLGTLGSPWSEGHGINDTGVVVGNSQLSGPGNVTRAFRWTNGTMVNMGTLPSGGNSYAHAINNSGVVVGMAGSHAAQWASNNVLTDLGTLTGMTGVSRALALNAAGVAVGHSDDANDEDHATRWANGVVTDLGVLPGHHESWARAINGAGQIVGHSGGAPVAFYHAGSGSMMSLGFLPGHASSLALDINNSGAIVGESGLTGDEKRAVLWSAFNAAAVDLNTFTPSGSVIMRSAVGINDSGQIIARGADFHAYLLSPIPEPIALAPVVGVIALLRRRQRKGWVTSATCAKRLIIR